MDNIINSKNMKNILQQAGCNTPASEAQIKLCNVKLIQHGFPELPEGFAKVLLEANGLTADDANIFGVGLEEGGWFDDVCDYNIQHCQAPSKRLVLGYDDDTRLIYYAEESSIGWNPRWAKIWNQMMSLRRWSISCASNNHHNHLNPLQKLQGIFLICFFERIVL